MHCIHIRVNGSGVDLEAMLALDGSGGYDARGTSTLRARAIKALLKGNQQSQSLISF